MNLLGSAHPHPTPLPHPYCVLFKLQSPCLQRGEAKIHLPRSEVVIGIQ